MDINVAIGNENASGMFFHAPYNPSSPDYSQKPLPDSKDYRRTLYWSPKVIFNDNGEAHIRLYNNSKSTVIGINIEGLTTDGHPVVWTDKN